MHIGSVEVPIGDFNAGSVHNRAIALIYLGPILRPKGKNLELINRSLFW